MSHSNTVMAQILKFFPRHEFQKSVDHFNACSGQVFPDTFSADFFS
jgi:hypothetical protein